MSYRISHFRISEVDVQISVGHPGDLAYFPEALPFKKSG
jgi:hypothetical protein